MDVRMPGQGERAAQGRRRGTTIIRAAVPALLGLGLLGGCSGNLQQQVSLLEEENLRLRSSLDERGAALDAMQRDLDECRSEQIALRDRASEPAPVGGAAAFGGIDGVETIADSGTVTARMEGDVLFASGQTTLKSSARSALDEVARVIRNRFGGQPVRVSGHTDSDPIRRTRDKFPTNYHLGFERAFAVREYLIGRGIPADAISVESFGPNRPAGSKQRSRRVEIAVVTG